MINRIIKNFIQSLFSLLNLEVTRKKTSNNKRSKSSEKADVLIDVAGTKIKVELNHPFSTLYSINPKYNSEFGRIAKIVLSKYPNSSIIDIGANVGDTLCIAKNAVDAEVLCIEGDKFLFGYLEENARQFNKVILRNFFLGEKSKNINVTTEKDGWNTTIIPNDGVNSRPLRLYTLDEVLCELDNKNFKLLKIDTEGYDTKIIKGAFNYLKNMQPAIFMEYNRNNMERINENGYETLQSLKGLGYNKILIYEDAGRFLLSCELESPVLKQLHNYIDGVNSKISYFDFCIFHDDDNDIAELFIASEEKYRLL